MTTLLFGLALVAVGAATGVLAGILGVGGGIFLVPFLVLAAGMSQHAAEATSLLVIVPTALVASLTLRSRGIGDLRAALSIGAIGAAGAAGGALLALALPGQVLRLCFAVLLALIGVRLVRDGLATSKAPA